jgi:hypothetical protein
MVGAQGFEGAVDNIICPHNTFAGGATVGLWLTHFQSTSHLFAGRVSLKTIVTMTLNSFGCIP